MVPPTFRRANMLTINQAPAHSFISITFVGEDSTWISRLAKNVIMKAFIAHPMC